MTLVLETLGSDETLDTRCLGVRFLAFTLGLNFTADDEFADLVIQTKDQHQLKRYHAPHYHKSLCAGKGSGIN